MQNKKNVIIVLVILLFLVILTLVVLLFTNSNVDNNSDMLDNSLIKNTELTVLEGKDNTFFTIQKIVNNYYEVIKSGNKENLYKVLDKEYIQDYGVTLDNIYDYIPNNYEDTSYIAEEISYIKGDNVVYYFVNGYLLNNIIVTEEIEYYDNISYLVIVDNNNQLYAIYPLKNIDLNSFINTYEFRNSVDLNNNNTFENVTILENNKLSTYINEFLTLMYIDSNKAYDMLDDETKALFGSLSNFESNLMEIYNNLSPVVFSYTDKEYDNYILYEIIDNNDNRVRIQEFNTMNYHIGFDFL